MNTLQQLMDCCWHLICHSSEVQDPGQYVLISNSVADIAVCNDKGKLLAFDNICPHRGARFLSGYSGQQKLICPYHGFCYIDGGLRIGSRALIASSADKIDVRKYFVAEFAGFIFIARAPVLSLEQQFNSAVHEQLSAIAASIDAPSDVNPFKFPASAQVSVENALEAIHLNHVHPTSLARLRLDEGKLTDLGYCSTWRANIGDKRSASLLNKLARKYQVENKHSGYTNILIFPFTMISTTAGLSFSIQNFFPSKDGQSDFYSRLYPHSRVRADNKMASFLESTSAMNRQVFQEDAQIIGRVSPNEQQGLGQFLVAGEERISWYRDAISSVCSLSRSGQMVAEAATQTK